LIQDWFSALHGRHVHGIQISKRKGKERKSYQALPIGIVETPRQTSIRGARAGNAAFTMPLQWPLSLFKNTISIGGAA